MIYIIGGQGFVGSAITRYCESNHLPHQVVTRDNYNQLTDKSCDILINANGNSKKFLAKDSPIEEFQLSVASVRSSLEDFKYDRYIHLSSCDVYPDCSSPDKNSESSAIDISKQSPYGFHKYLAEQCVMHAAPSWMILRLGGFVGPGLRKNPVYDIMNGGPLWLDPESELQFMHTDDAAALLMDLIKRNVDKEIFNVCGKGTIKLQDVIDRCGASIRIQPNSPRVVYQVNIEKLESIRAVPMTQETVIQFIDKTAE